MKNTFLKALAIVFVVSAAAQASEDVATATAKVGKLAALKTWLVSPAVRKTAISCGALVGTVCAGSEFVVKPVLNIKKDWSDLQKLQKDNATIIETGNLSSPEGNNDWAKNMGQCRINDAKISNLRRNIEKNAAKALVSTAIISGSFYVLYKKLSSN